MPAANFDSLTAARGLEAAGIDHGHAEAIVALHVRNEERLVTKRNLEPLATKAFVLQVAIGIVLANASLTVALVKLI